MATKVFQQVPSPIDFTGLSIYEPTYVRANDSQSGFAIVPSPASYPHMYSPWLRLGPEALYWAPKLATDLWKLKEVYITETEPPPRMNSLPKAPSTTPTSSCFCAITSPSFTAPWPRAYPSRATSSGASSITTSGLTATTSDSVSPTSTSPPETNAQAQRRLL